MRRRRRNSTHFRSVSVADDIGSSHAGRTLPQLRAVLDAAGYKEPTVEAALQQPVWQLDPVVASRRLLGSRRDTLIRLLLLSAPVSAAEVRSALAPLSLDRLLRAGLLSRRGATIKARVRLVPYDGLILACDLQPADPTRMPADYVDGATPPARLLAALTVRRPIKTALDLGTGGGVQALLAARHSRRVVAVDVNPRALRYTAFNARLNALPNIECRQGSLFGPVVGERFDLIVANPPFVISPEATLTLRDGGWPGDRFCRELVEEAPRYLTDGGWAVMLVNWIHTKHDAWWVPLRRWVEGEGFDAWLLRYRTEDSLDYAAMWNVMMRAGGPARYGRAIDRWRVYYRRLGIRAIGTGAILLRCRSAPRHWLRGDDFPNEITQAVGNQILRTVQAQDFLAGLADNRALLTQRFSLVARHRLEQRVGSRGPHRAVLRLEAPLAFSVEVSPVVLELLRRLDGHCRLEAAIAELARTSRRPPTALTRAVLPAIRRLVRAGLLRRTVDP